MGSRRQLDIDRDEEENKQDDQKKKGYAWEAKIDRSWDKIQEDESGRIKAVIKEDQAAKRRRRAALIPGIKRGIVRYTVLAIDNSAVMNDQDMKPSRGICVLSLCEEFVREFFDQNPIAHMAIIRAYNGGAHPVASIGSSPQALCASLADMAEKESFRGEASLQNILELSRKILEPIPPYGSKEVIIVFGSLSTTDPGDVMTSITAMQERDIKCSVVGLAAEVYILRQVAKKTKGDYFVAMDEDHFQELLSEHVAPRPLGDGKNIASLVEMGFPVLKHLEKAKSFFDVKSEARDAKRVGAYGYECPRCNAWLSDVPAECVLCGLTLITSPHLARSYHHLFPVDPFKEIPTEEANGKSNFCLGCRKKLDADEVRLQCPLCTHLFCYECDIFIHDFLHNCPGCLARQSAVATMVDA